MSNVTTTVDDSGIAEVVVERPPVNALGIADWQAIADALIGIGRETRVVILSAVGRGWNAGVDIKELHAAADQHAALVAVNRACANAFAAVYDCEVPVIAAVHGFCLGGGIGLAGNADIVIASDDATFGLPEVDRGALGAATHLARLVPQHLMRAMVYTGRKLPAAELARYGGILEVVPRDRLRAAARSVAGEIAAKSPIAIRAAKQSLNGIDPIDVKRSYRYEQGFTFELTLAGVGDEKRKAFAQKSETK
ncbi:MAG TPA: enoyl-CoA hydratase family protein [Kofleriaceae bacterium]|nr:enoyl-CoA hydratase family protein [Kofleriaceae bacterium]